MTLKTSTWQPEQPLPRYADRKTLAAIITHNFFRLATVLSRLGRLRYAALIEPLSMKWPRRWSLLSKKWKAQFLINKEVGDMVKALNTPPSKDLRGAAVKAPISHRERDDNYDRVIVQLAPRWRVIICKDGIQFILQKRSSKHSNKGMWIGKSYPTTRDALISICSSLKLLSDPRTTAVLKALPDHARNYIKE